MMQFLDYIRQLDDKIRSLSTNPAALSDLEIITDPVVEPVAKIRGQARSLQAQRTGNRLVALVAYENDAEIDAAYQSFNDDLADPKIDEKAEKLAPLLDWVPED